MKIFTVGLSRTGTLSVHTAMQSLGISSVHLPLGLSEIYRNIHAADITVSSEYKNLSNLYPSALFILTKRSDEVAWVNSIVKHYANLESWKSSLPKRDRKIIEESELKLYGTKNPENLKKEDWLEIYFNWEKEIKEYFYEHDSRFAIIETGSGKEWNSIFKLFSDNGFPKPYPHTHKS